MVRERSERSGYSSRSVVAILLLGFFLRAYFVFGRDFPIGDGGLFYAMITDIETNSFGLPSVTSYNHLGIPFVYPPFGLYFAALLHTLSGLSLLQVMTLVGPFWSCLSLLAFWGIAEALIENKSGRICALATYALSSFSFEWVILGGGVTRGPGLFFSLLAIRYFLDAIKMPLRPRLSLVPGLCGGLAMLAHPAAGLFLVVTIALLAVARWSKLSLREFLLFLSVSALIVSPWISYELLTNGSGPFVAGFRSGNAQVVASSSFFPRMLQSVVALDLTLIILLVVGVCARIREKQFLVLIWLAFAFSNPRYAGTFFSIPLCVLCGVGAESVLALVAKANIGLRDRFQKAGALSVRAGVVLASAAFFFSLFFSSFVRTTGIVAYNSVAPDGVAIYNWAKNFSHPSDRFIVLSSHVGTSDNFAEWFPAMSERASVLNWEGREWQPDAEYERIVKFRAELGVAVEQKSSNLREILQRVPRVDYWIVEKPLLSLVRPSDNPVFESTRYAVIRDGRDATIEDGGMRH